MADATFARTDFRGGQWSKWSQGRFHDQRYPTALTVCQNGLPTETGAWVRRPGFALAGATRQGVPGRVIKFDFNETTAPPYTLLFTDGNLWFWSGLQLVTTNDAVRVTALSNADPAEMTLAAPVGWNTSDRGYFTGVTENPQIENRVFVINKVDTTHFTLLDQITGAGLNGPLVGGLPPTATFNHVLDFTTPYIAGSWQQLRLVQSDADGTPVAFLLHSDFAPQALAVVTEPTGAFGGNATFNFGAAIFQDGPYLDPLINGAQLTANQQTGIIQLTLSFPAWVSTTSYAAGDVVTYSSVNYESLVDQNINNEPDTSPSAWSATDGSAAINNGQGFLHTDIGRLIRLFSEPALYNSTTTYSSGQLVAYNPDGLPGGTTYWSSLVGSNVGNTPGTDTTHWQLLQQGGDNSPALWTWGQITSLINSIPGAPSGIVYIGDMTAGGGLSAAFDGNTDQNASASAQITGSASGSSVTIITTAGWVGQNFSGCSQTSYKVQSATIFPSVNEGLAFVSFSPAVGLSFTAKVALTASLYGSNSNPSSATNGTLLGQVTSQTSGSYLMNNSYSLIGAPVIIPSTVFSAHSYIWVVISVTFTVTSTQYPTQKINEITLTLNAGQVQLTAVPGSAVTDNGVKVELLGPPLLYNTTIRTWRLGVYSATTGWPSVGAWTDGRLCLSGAVPNRVDMSCSNGVTVDIAGTTVNFAPTDQYGNVLDSSGISLVMNLPESNPVLWMMPDQQGVVCGTATREALVYAPTAGGLTPTNIDARQITRIGGAFIEPQKCEHTFVFVQKYLRKVVEMFADIFSGKFTAPNLIADAKNLSVDGLQELAYQQELVPVVWARVNNSLIGCTYKRDTLMTSSGPTFNGWHEHTLGGGWSVTSICTGSSVDGNLDALTAVTVDPTTGYSYVQVLTDVLDEGALQSEASYLDAAITPSSTQVIAAGNPDYPYAGLQINGLWNLNGQLVTAWLGGLDLGDRVVENGIINIAYGDGIGNGQGSYPSDAWSSSTTYGINATVNYNGVVYVGLTTGNINNAPGASPTNWALHNRNDQGLFTSSFVASGVTANGTIMWTGTMPMSVGFSYTSQGQVTPPRLPQEAGSRNGPAFGKLAREHYIMMQLEGAQGVSGGTTLSAVDTLIFTQADDMTPLTVDQQFTGVFRFQPSGGDYDFMSAPCWQVTRPYICNVPAVGAAQEAADV